MPKNPIPIWWKIFATEYVKSGENATGAYRKARPKVSQKVAEANGCRLLRNAKVLGLIEQERQGVIKSTRIDKDEWMRRVLSLAERGSPDATRLRAYELLGKACGHLGEKVDITTNGETMKVICLPRLGAPADEAD